MNKNRNKKRYNTANEIRDDIDKFKLKQQKLMDSAAALDAKADSLFKTGDAALAEDAVFAREQAKKKRASALRIERRKLVQLKNKMAEFLTPTLPGSGIEDRSIQAT